MKEKGHGHIINITSDSERYPFAGVSVYTGKMRNKWVCLNRYRVNHIKTHCNLLNLLKLKRRGSDSLSGGRTAANHILN